MYLTDNEVSLLEALYDVNRIPLWIYDQDKRLLNFYFSTALPQLAKKLSNHMDLLLPKIINPDFDLLWNDNELYYIFSFKRNEGTFYCMGGPMLLSGIYPPTAVKSLSFSHNMNIKELEILTENLPVISLSSFNSSLRITMLLLKQETISSEEINCYKLSNLKDSMNSTFIHELFDNREEARIHTPYSHELAVLNCIREGNVAQLESTYRTLPQIKYGNMSSNPLRQLFYGCIANTTLVTRYAIEGGLEEKTAYTLSDVYIRQMEKCTTLYELNVLNEKMAVDFTEHVANAKAAKQTAYKDPIVKCIDYIFMKLHQKITLAELAKEVNLTPKYLSNLFHQETGHTLSSFIEDKRIEEAKNLLIYSEYSYSEISSYLSFSSQSYFISVFKKKAGMTPKEYRCRYSRSNWEISR